MKCFNCGYELNPKGAEQCQVCGVKFEQNCTGCGASNPPYAKFCLECGQDLQNETQVKLQETKRQVAVLFADVSGFTALSERRDPEEVREIINETFQYITRPVYELEGTIDKYIGDCVMVLFGAKYAHKDDSARALRCALEMQRLIEEYSQTKLKKQAIDLKLSIGINFGIVVTGQVGNYYDKDYTVIGDVVNTAQRLQDSAPAGDIYVSESVFQNTYDIADYSKPIKLALKNKGKLESVYQPISVKPILDSSLVIERDDELTHLNNILVSDKKIVNITGESGLGKTALVKEFLAQIDESMKKIWVNTSITQKSKPFSLISNIISEILNIKLEDSIRVKENRMRSFLDYILRDESEDAIIRNYNFLALISGLRMDAEYQTLIHSMEYVDIRVEILQQTQLFFERLGQRQLTIFVVEDADFADADSVEVLNNFSSDQFTGLIISQTELDYLKADEVIELKPFNKEKTEHLITHIVMNEVEKSTLDLVYKYSNGNPMFVEELIATSRRKGLVISNTPFTLHDSAAEVLPATMSGIILGKIQELSEDEIEVLQVASVIGDEFSLNWIEDILLIDEDILTKLVNYKLIEFRRNVVGKETEKIYGFVQKVIRDVIYNDLLSKTKVRLHKNVARTVEVLDHYEEFFDVLAYHFKHSKNARKESKYAFLHAKDMIDFFNYPVAIDYLNRVDKDSSYYAEALKEKSRLHIVLTEFEDAIHTIDKAETLNESIDYLNEVKLLKASLLREQAAFEECLSIITELEEKLEEDSNLMGRVLQIKTAVLLMTGQPEVIEVALKSEQILSKTKDYNHLADTISYAGIASFMRGKLEDAEDYFKKGLNYAELSSNISAVSKISSNLGILYHATGDMVQSTKHLNEAMEAANQAGSVKNYCTASINLGVFYMEKGLFSQAKPLFVETLEKASTASLIYQQCISLTNLADLYIELGDFKKAVELYSSSLQISRDYSLKYEEGVNLLGVAKANCKMELSAETELEEAYKIFLDAKELLNISDYFRIKAEYINHSVETIDDAIENAKEAGSELKTLQALTVKGILTEDELLFNEAIELAKRIESDYELAKVMFKQYQVLPTKQILTSLKEIRDRLDTSLLKENIEKL